MRQIQFGLLAGSFATLATLFAIGCGGVVDRDDEQLTRRTSKGATKFIGATVEKLSPVKGDYKGVIEGEIEWEGDKPGNLEDETAKLQAAIKGSNDRQTCESGSKCETEQPAYRIGDNKKLGNVFVWIAPLPKHAFDVPEEQLKKVKKEVLLSQPRCAFVPHCAAVFAGRYDFKEGSVDTKTGQVLVVQNDAPVAHNASVKGESINQNVLLKAFSGKGDTDKVPMTLLPERDAVRISCGVHGWMSAYVRSFDHPYFAVSSVGADYSDPKKPVYENLAAPNFGTFKIEGVPVGTEVRLFAWHEDLGHLKGSSGEKITLTANQKIVIKAKRK